MTTARRGANLALGTLLAASLLAGQAVTDASMHARGGPQAGEVFGRAGFAYLTGLRRFAALLLWNRLEPQYHEYYSGRSLKDQTFLLPNLRVVLMLDPRFIQAYYMAPWVVRDNGLVDDAIAIARQGAADNPDSGLLHTSLAQILYLERRDQAESLREADLAMRPDQLWADATEQWESMKIIADIYRSAGLADRAETAIAITKQLEAAPGTVPGLRDPGEQF
jgi:tetratricopeptide (TPR) repeat protein